MKRLSIIDVWSGQSGSHPATCMESQVLRLVTSKFGTVVKVYSKTLRKRNLQRARILIKTSSSEIQKTPIEVQVNGRLFYIRTRDEEECLDEDFDEDSSDGVCEDDDNDDDLSWV